jgi:glutathione S-transferase
MILIGQYDSPFVRRVAVAMREYNLPYEHRPWSVWGQSEDIARLNPLRRVPTLLLDDGEVLVESAAILDALDDMVGPEHALVARSGFDRRGVLRVCAMSMGMADKAVSLLYEHVLRKDGARSEVWIDRCRKQIGEVLALLEEERARHTGAFWFGRLTHADIALTCALRFVSEAHPSMLDRPSLYPSLRAQAARCEAMASFKAAFQALHVAV